MRIGGAAVKTAAKNAARKKPTTVRRWMGRWMGCHLQKHRINSAASRQLVHPTSLGRLVFSAHRGSGK
jgi:hypothetical protein